MASGRIDHSFSISTTGSAVAVRAALALVRAKMQARGLADDICGTVEIALAEALNNIAEHAYAFDADGPVEILGRIYDRKLRVTLRDQGKPMPGLALPKGDLPDPSVALDDLPEGGFGWFLIRQLTEELCYTRDAGENCLTLVFPLPDNTG